MRNQLTVALGGVFLAMAVSPLLSKDVGPVKALEYNKDELVIQAAVGEIAPPRLRDDAYRIVQRNALQAWEGERHLRSLLEDDPEVTLSATTLDHIFDTTAFLRNADIVFARLEALEV